MCVPVMCQCIKIKGQVWCICVLGLFVTKCVTVITIVLTDGLGTTYLNINYKTILLLYQAIFCKTYVVNMKKLITKGWYSA